MSFGQQFEDGIKIIATTCICGGIGLGIAIALAPISTVLALGVVGATVGASTGFIGAAIAIDGPEVVIRDLKKIFIHYGSKLKNLTSPIKTPTITNETTPSQTVKPASDDLVEKTAQSDFSNSATAEQTNKVSNENTAKPANKKQNTLKK